MPHSVLKLTGKENIDSSHLFQKEKTTDLRGHGLKLYKKRSRLDVLKHFIQPKKIVDYWNRLPNDIVTAATTSSFKNRLHTWMDRYGH